MSRISKLSTDELEELRDQAEARGDSETVEQCDDELERRAYDASDLWSPENHHD